MEENGRMSGYVGTVSRFFKSLFLEKHKTIFFIFVIIGANLAAECS